MGDRLVYMKVEGVVPLHFSLRGVWIYAKYTLLLKLILSNSYPAAKN